MKRKTIVFTASNDSAYSNGSAYDEHSQYLQQKLSALPPASSLPSFKQFQKEIREVIKK